jgi:hypothetical protein
MFVSTSSKILAKKGAKMSNEKTSSTEVQTTEVQTTEVVKKDKKPSYRTGSRYDLRDKSGKLLASDMTAWKCLQFVGAVENKPEIREIVWDYRVESAVRELGYTMRLKGHSEIEVGSFTDAAQELIDAAAIKPHEITKPKRNADGVFV